ncbi:acyl carrier protein [Streptomyces acidiscabies]|uniref:Acyl carrier protein n=1 Tax=Streptomyces acidiscabies TaxID=42234 RepID=A0A0L0JKQ3_9ACTN|nr:acyl carrier protein [Streptomyces acidiscabies]KND26276.1 acyl carrier protein [Streptomyces acidiscabies]
MTRTEKIVRFIEEQFLIEFGAEVTPQSDLFKDGVIDSYGYIRLMSFLEEEFSLDIRTEEFLLNVPATLEDLDRFVAEKQGA